MNHDLVFQIAKSVKGEDGSVSEIILANAYFKDGAYTALACKYTENVISFIEANDKEGISDDVDYALKVLEIAGASPDMIQVTEKGIEKNNKEAEKKVIINLTEQTINFDVFNELDDSEYFDFMLDNYDEASPAEPGPMGFDFDTKHLSFTDFEELEEGLFYELGVTVGSSNNVLFAIQ